MSNHEHDHDDHDHHHTPEIPVANPVTNTGHNDGCHGQPLPGIFVNQNPDVTITVLEDKTVKMVITDSIKTYTYFIKAIGDGLKITTLLPHGICAERGNNGEFYINPTHVN